MSEDLKVSTPGEVARVTRLIKLPEPQNGVEIVLRVGAVPKLAIIEALEGIPGVGGAVPATERKWEEVKETVKASARPEARLAELGIVEPAFSFGEREEGKAYWPDLLMENQGFVVAQVLDVSGWKGAKPKDGDTFSGGATG